MAIAKRHQLGQLRANVWGPVRRHQAVLPALAGFAHGQAAGCWVTPALPGVWSPSRPATASAQDNGRHAKAAAEM